MIVEFKLIFVGILWGLTNPFMEKGINDKPVNQTSSNSFLYRQFTNLKVIIPFVLNQLASAFNLTLLPQVSISQGPLISNTSNIITTMLTEKTLKNERIDGKQILGTLSILIGIALIILQN